MEKFGIFELLDALAAITEQENNREEKPTAQDSVFQAPVYGSAPASDSRPEQDVPKRPVQSPHPEKDALAGFYARHNAIAKKAGKK